MIPPSKALEVFINRISSEITNVDAVLVTGYPRNMRDVVEYMARVSPGIKFSKKKISRLLLKILTFFMQFKMF